MRDGLELLRRPKQLIGEIQQLDGNWTGHGFVSALGANTEPHVLQCDGNPLAFVLNCAALPHHLGLTIWAVVFIH